MSAPYEYGDNEYEYDDYDEADEYDEDDDYIDVVEVQRPRAASNRRVAKRGAAPQESVTARRAIDWGTAGGIVTIIVLTLLYAVSPVDVIPDVIPVAGQVDDAVALTAGTATAGVLAFLRIALRSMLASRVGRKGCVILAAAMGVVTILAFVGLVSLVNAIF